MIIELPRLIEALRRTLQEEVRPELTSDHARGQLAAVQDILGKLEGMVVWQPEAALRQARVLDEGCDAFLARLAQEGVQPDLPVATEDAAEGTADAADAPGAEAVLRAAEQRIMRLTDWLCDAGAALPPPLRAELDTILRQALRQQLVIQRKLIPLTDFGAMTAAASRP